MVQPWVFALLIWPDAVLHMYLDGARQMKSQRDR